MAKHAKYEIQLADFTPVAYDNVRWLNEDDFHYMNEFCNMDIETWSGGKKEGFTYCAVIEDDKIVSLAAVWKYSQDKWETAAANTRKNYENRGLAKRVVSFSTDYIFKQNKIPTLTTGEDNIPMRKVAESIGFKLKELKELKELKDKLYDFL
jgi:RimJ/RimL family protein N-acetyltransferase